MRVTQSRAYTCRTWTYTKKNRQRLLLSLFSAHCRSPVSVVCFYSLCLAVTSRLGDNPFRDAAGRRIEEYVAQSTSLEHLLYVIISRSMERRARSPACNHLQLGGGWDERGGRGWREKVRERMKSEREGGKGGWVKPIPHHFAFLTLTTTQLRNSLDFSWGLSSQQMEAILKTAAANKDSCLERIRSVHRGGPQTPHSAALQL